MKKTKHWAIYGSGLSVNTEYIINLLHEKAIEDFENYQGETSCLFSNITLQQFIREEAIHDAYTLSENGQKSIRNFSSGEQKKALLKHLLSKNPDFIILDNVFDMLDAAFQIDLLDQLVAIANHTTVIQVFRRRSDVLPFIQRIIRLKEGKIVFSGSIVDYDKQFSNELAKNSETAIPLPIHQNKSISNPLIQFNNVSVAYQGKAILKNINWEINKGEFWQLTGPNGAGKTTLLTMLTGDNPKAYGQNILLFGQKKGSGESVWEIKKKIGYVTPAMTELFNGRHSLEKMILSGLYDSIGLYKTPSIQEKIVAEKWIDLIGLQSDKNTYFYQLSEEKQCLALIARAMIKHPPLLILDEPTHGLDDEMASLLIALINNIARERTTAIIYVSHKAEEGLIPDHIFELTSTVKGSIGRIKS